MPKAIDNSFPDEDGDNSDWIELHNLVDVDVNLEVAMAASRHQHLTCCDNDDNLVDDTHPKPSIASY